MKDTETGKWGIARSNMYLFFLSFDYIYMLCYAQVEFSFPFSSLETFSCLLRGQERKSHIAQSAGESHLLSLSHTHILGLVLSNPPISRPSNPLRPRMGKLKGKTF